MLPHFQGSQGFDVLTNDKNAGHYSRLSRLQRLLFSWANCSEFGSKLLQNRLRHYSREIYYKIHILAVSIPGKCKNRIRFLFSSQDIPTNGWMVLSGGRSAIWQFKISTKQKTPLYFSWVHGQVGTVLMSHLCILSLSLATETSLLVQNWIAPATSLTHLEKFSLNFWYLSFVIRVNLLHP